MLRVLRTLSLAVFPSQAGAQAVAITIDHASACSACVIELTRVHDVGSTADPVAIGGGIGHLLRRTRGDYVAISGDGSQIVVFDAQGKYVRAVGRKGSGPGEFGPSITRTFLAKGDSLFVLDASFHFSVFGPELEYVTRTSLPPSTLIAGASLEDGTLLWSGTIRTAQQIGWPLHIISRDGRVLRSLGDENRTPGPDGRPVSTSRSFVITKDRQSLWQVAPQDVAREYTLERRSITDGKIRQSYRIVNVPWIRAPESVVLAGGRSGPRTIVSSRTPVYLRGIDGHGRLWIETQVIAPGDPSSSAQRHFLQVFDPATGRLSVARSIDRHGWYLFPYTDLISSMSANADGLITYSVWRVAAQVR